MSEQQDETQTTDEPETTAEPEPDAELEPDAEPDAETEPEPEPDGDGDDEPEPTEPATASGPRSEKEVRKFQQDVERLYKDTAGRVGRIFGEDAVHLIECPLCASAAPGFFWSPDVRPLDEDQTTILRQLLNIPVPADYRTSDAYLTCPECDGLGKVRTGSKVDSYSIAECHVCNSRGWVKRGASQDYATIPNGDGHGEVLTGPTVYPTGPAQVQAEDEPAVAALRQRGYMIVPPVETPRPAV